MKSKMKPAPKHLLKEDAIGEAKEFPVIESMTTIKIARLTIRVWRDEEEVAEFYPNADLATAAAEYWRKDMGNPTRAGLARLIAAMPRVNAVEVKDGDGEGIVCYVQWP